MSAARAGYTMLVWLVMPLVAIYLLWRSWRQPEYRAHWGERFGWTRYARLDTRPLIWLHAVSVGETRAAEPLVDALALRYPQHQFLLTHMTPTGRATGQTIVGRHPGRIVQIYLPYDLPFAVRRMLRHFAPVVGIGLETETWPNLLALAREAGIPMVLVNARLSERSFAKAARAPRLLREAAANFALVLAQTEADAVRMRKVGAQRVVVVGNLKFDNAPSAEQVEQGRALRATLAHPVLLFAATREGEETLILDALRQAASALAAIQARILIVPRHPQRFDEVAGLVAARGWEVVRRFEQADFGTVAAARAGAVLLGDSMGEMALYYAAADVATIGGSLAPLGGQNLIEACAVGTPVVMGPHTFNFAQAAEDALAVGAARRVADASEAVAAMLEIADPARRQLMSAAALRFAEQHRGATARTVAQLAPFIDTKGDVEARPAGEPRPAS